MGDSFGLAVGVTGGRGGVGMGVGVAVGDGVGVTASALGACVANAVVAGPAAVALGSGDVAPDTELEQPASVAAARMTIKARIGMPPLLNAMHVN